MYLYFVRFVLFYSHGILYRPFFLERNTIIPQKYNTRHGGLASRGVVGEKQKCLEFIDSFLCIKLETAESTLLRH